MSYLMLDYNALRYSRVTVLGTGKIVLVLNEVLHHDDTSCA